MRYVVAVFLLVSGGTLRVWLNPQRTQAESAIALVGLILGLVLVVIFLRQDYTLAQLVRQIKEASNDTV